MTVTAQLLFTLYIPMVVSVAGVMYWWWHYMLPAIGEIEHDAKVKYQQWKYEREQYR